MGLINIIIISCIYSIMITDGKQITRKKCTRNELKLPGCPAEVIVDWWDYGPYVYDVTEGGIIEVQGYMKEIVEMMIRECCGECVTFKYLQPTITPKLLNTKIGNNNTLLYFPVYGHASTLKFQNYPYFAVIEPPGSIYFQGRTDTQDIPQAVMAAVFSGWPVFVLTLIMAAMSGIVIWATDSFCNTDFPKSFFKGSWEGFWWAFVSMTTVGYGDKVPKSFLAKVFAFFWVLIGLVIIGIFTATISTALTALCLRNDVELYGESITALKDTQEERYGTSNNAEVHTVTNMTDFVKKILNKEVRGGLVDSYVAGFYEKELRPLHFAKVFEENQYSYGFVLANELNNIVIPKCLRRQLSANESDIDNIVLKMEVMKEPAPNPALEKSLRLFDGGSKVFQNAVYLCLGLSAFLLLVGVVWEYMYYKPRNGIKPLQDDEKKVVRAVPYLDVYGGQCRDIEEFTLNMVEKFHLMFKDKMKDVGNLRTEIEEVNPGQS